MEIHRTIGSVIGEIMNIKAKMFVNKELVFSGEGIESLKEIDKKLA
jgi:hypothetical protein